MVERWREVGNGVLVRRHRSLDLNVTAVLCQEGVVLIDTRANPAQAADLATSLRAITRDPVRWVINTHHHWDHAFGNQVFGDAEIWGHARCATALRDHGEAMRAEVIRLSPDHSAEFDAVVITPPDHTFTADTTVSMGGRQVVMHHLGRGHTDNDIVVVVPDAGVVVAGDLIEQGAPPSFGDSFPLDWPDAVERLQAMSGGTVVPGHGAVVDATFVSGQWDELKIVARLARQHHAAGLDPHAAAEIGGPYTPEVLASAFVRAWRHMEGA